MKAGLVKTWLMAALLALASGAAATAQTYPARPITIVAPFQRADHGGIDLGEPEALGAWYVAEIAKWWPIIKAQGLKVE